MTTPDHLDPITGEDALDPTLLDERELLPEVEEASPATPPLDEPAPLPEVEEARPAAPPPPPAPVQPEAERGRSDGSLVCTGCLRPIGAGETYVQTAVRGSQHLEPCSHRA